MKKSICIEKIFLEAPFYERFKLVKDAGFDYIEFWAWCNKDMQKVNDLCGQYGLKIASMSGDRIHSMIIPEERQGFIDYLGKSLEVAKDSGCGYLVMHSNAIDEDGAMEKTGENLSDTTKISAAALAMEEAAVMAGKAGITLVIESINTTTKPGYYMCTTPMSGDLARAIDSPRVKILYDTFHMQQMEGNMVSTLRNYFDVLGYVHIGDVPERNEPGTGEINFGKLKAVLSDLGYDGFYGFELSPAQSSAACAKILKAF